MSNPTNMLAAVWYGPSDLRLEERPVPEVVPGSVLVKVAACAICGSDLRIFRDGNNRITEPRIIGHEISGIVTDIGAGVHDLSPGDRVSIGADIPCGKCRHCLSGRANCCDINFAIGYQFDGGYAEYVRLDPLVVEFGPVQRFSKTLPWSHAALAEPLACCVNGYERALVRPGEAGTVVIFGAGPIGLMLMLIGRQAYRADQVIVVEPAPVRRQMAAELGADMVLDPGECDPVEVVMEVTGGHGAQAIFTACPAVETHEQALSMVAKRGVVNLFGGLPSTAPPISFLSNNLHYHEAYLTGSHGSTPDQHRQALSLIETGEVDVAPLISKQVKLDSIHDAFALAASGGAAKVVVGPMEDV